MYEFVYALLTKRKCFKKNRKCVFGWHKPGMALTKNGTHCLFGAFCLLKIKTLAFIYYFFSSIDSTNLSDDKSWFCLSFSLIFYYFVISFLFVLNSTAVHAEYCCMIVKVRKVINDRVFSLHLIAWMLLLNHTLIAINIS